MNKEYREIIYRKAFERFGKVNQITVAIEEMSELTKELCKNLFRGAENHKALIEEIADVTIMLEQLRLIYEANDEVCEQMDRKIERMYERLYRTAPRYVASEGAR